MLVDQPIDVKHMAKEYEEKTKVLFNKRKRSSRLPKERSRQIEIQNATSTKYKWVFVGSGLCFIIILFGILSTVSGTELLCTHCESISAVTQIYAPNIPQTGICEFLKNHHQLVKNAGKRVEPNVVVPEDLRVYRINYLKHDQCFQGTMKNLKDNVHEAYSDYPALANNIETALKSDQTQMDNYYSVITYRPWFSNNYNGYAAEIKMNVTKEVGEVHKICINDKLLLWNGPLPTAPIVENMKGYLQLTK